MGQYLIDTCICVRLLRGDLSVADAIDRIGIDQCCISEITKAELLIGEGLAIAKGRNIDRSALPRLFSRLCVIPVSSALELYVSEKLRLRAMGAPLEDFDLLIGCTAVSSGMVLVTDNVQHLSRISGLRIERW